MSKKYKGKVCVYCGKKPSTTGDHVFARKFFLEKHREGLPQVPACAGCNAQKSVLEHYLTTVLPFGARHRDASLILQTMVPKRLQKNEKLRAQLKEGYTGEKIPFQSGRIEQLFTLIAKGLLWYHWRAILGADDRAAATVLLPSGSERLDHVLSALRPPNRVNVNLGEGAFIYEGLQTTDSTQSSLWRFLIYGGLCFAEDSRDPRMKSSLILAITGPKALLASFWRAALGEEMEAGN